MADYTLRAPWTTPAIIDLGAAEDAKLGNRWGFDWFSFSQGRSS